MFFQVIVRCHSTHPLRTTDKLSLHYITWGQFWILKRLQAVANDQNQEVRSKALRKLLGSHALGNKKSEVRSKALRKLLGSNPWAFEVWINVLGTKKFSESLTFYFLLLSFKGLEPRSFLRAWLPTSYFLVLVVCNRLQTEVTVICVKVPPISLPLPTYPRATDCQTTPRSINIKAPPLLHCSFKGAWVSNMLLSCCIDSSSESCCQH